MHHLIRQAVFLVKYSDSELRAPEDGTTVLKTMALLCLNTSVFDIALCGMRKALQLGAYSLRGSFSGPVLAGSSSTFASSAAVVAGATNVGSQAPPYSLFKAYFLLSKARLSLLVASTASAGYVLGSGSEVDWAGMGFTTLGTFLAAASANAINQVWEKDNDMRMRRTMRRPLPSGRLTPLHALGFAAAAGAAGVGLLSATSNDTAAGLGAANIGLYSLVYTPLKVLHPINTWVGAVVGAVPPLMGWAAASGGALEPAAAILAAGLYFWQLPHFMALAWMCKADYAAGGYRMLSAIDATGRRTAMCALRNCIYLAPLGLAAVNLGLATEPLAWESAVLAGAMGAAAVAFYARPSVESAKVLFRASLLHLPLLMTLMLVHRVPQTHDATLSDTATLPMRWMSGSRPTRTDSGAESGTEDSDAEPGPSGRAAAGGWSLPVPVRAALGTIEGALFATWDAVVGGEDRIAVRLRNNGIECPSRLAADEGHGEEGTSAEKGPSAGDGKSAGAVAPAKSKAQEQQVGGKSAR